MRLQIEFVTDLVFGENDTFTAKGLGGHELEGVVGVHLGFNSRPKDGATGVVLKPDGEGNSAILVAYGDSQYHLTLEKGEAGGKNAFDAYWLLNKDGVLELNGTDYDAPKWNDWLTYFDGFLVKLKADLTAGASGGCTTTSTDTLAVAVPAGLSSSKVKNG